ncbi:MAG: 4-hydroxy-tetrahydrodipicolinate reductase [Pseudomonadota bacterium]
MAEETRIGIAGVAGRMGRMLTAAVAETDDCRLVAGTALAESPELAMDIGTLAGLAPLGITPGVEAADLFAASDLVMDFTAPTATRQHLALAGETGKALLIGTTGLAAEDLAAIDRAAQTAPILIASNTSLGVTLLQRLVTEVARALDESYDIEVVEMHHKMKVDAPSGTALTLGKAAAAGRGKSLEELWVKSRDGHTGARESGTIGFATLRGGDVVGEHSVIFAGPGERIELTHKAQSRQLFAQGAVRAARWLASKPPGLYTMEDVLGI